MKENIVEKLAGPIVGSEAIQYIPTSSFKNLPYEKVSNLAKIKNIRLENVAQS